MVHVTNDDEKWDLWENLLLRQSQGDAPQLMNAFQVRGVLVRGRSKNTAIKQGGGEHCLNHQQSGVFMVSLEDLKKKVNKFWRLVAHTEYWTSFPFPLCREAEDLGGDIQSLQHSVSAHIEDENLHWEHIPFWLDERIYSANTDCFLGPAACCLWCARPPRATQERFCLSNLELFSAI